MTRASFSPLLELRIAAALRLTTGALRRTQNPWIYKMVSHQWTIESAVDDDGAWGLGERVEYPLRISATSRVTMGPLGPSSPPLCRYPQRLPSVVGPLLPQLTAATTLANQARSGGSALKLPPLVQPLHSQVGAIPPTLTKWRVTSSPVRLQTSSTSRTCTVRSGPPP